MSNRYNTLQTHDNTMIVVNGHTLFIIILFKTKKLLSAANRNRIMPTSPNRNIYALIETRIRHNLPRRAKLELEPVAGYARARARV